MFTALFNYVPAPLFLFFAVILAGSFIKQSADYKRKDRELAINEFNSRIKVEELHIKEYEAHIRAAGTTVKLAPLQIPGSVQAVLTKRNYLQPQVSSPVSAVNASQTSPVFTSMATALTGVSPVPPVTPAPAAVVSVAPASVTSAPVAAVPVATAPAPAPVVSAPVAVASVATVPVTATLAPADVDDATDVLSDDGGIVWIDVDAHVDVNFFVDFNVYFMSITVGDKVQKLSDLPGSIAMEDVLDYAAEVGKSVAPSIRSGTFSEGQVSPFSKMAA
jgi:hypothetical protein